MLSFLRAHQIQTDSSRKIDGNCIDISAYIFSAIAAAAAAKVTKKTGSF